TVYLSGPAPERDLEAIEALLAEKFPGALLASPVLLEREARDLIQRDAAALFLVATMMAVALSALLFGSLARAGMALAPAALSIVAALGALRLMGLPVGL